MTPKIERFNDGSNKPPRPRVSHALWSLIKLPMNSETEWTLDEKFSRVKEAGFKGVECWLSDENEQETKDALDKYGLNLILGHRPYKVDDVRQTVERALRLK